MIVHRGWLQDKHVETVHFRPVFGRIALSMMIGRAVGWMEWSGLVKGRAGDGDGLQQHDDGIVCFMCETLVFR